MNKIPERRITVYPKAGHIYYATLPYEEHLQSGKRPVLIAQNNKGNAHASFVHVIPLTSRLAKANRLPTHTIIQPSETNGLERTSVALVENIRPVPKDCIGEHIGQLAGPDLANIGSAMRVQFPFLG
jgi:mRNA interferase MazF